MGAWFPAFGPLCTGSRGNSSEENPWADADMCLSEPPAAMSTSARTLVRWAGFDYGFMSLGL
eukprot:9774733-Alexandrium_andersonii.AAC.1